MYTLTFRVPNMMHIKRNLLTIPDMVYFYNSVIPAPQTFTLWWFLISYLLSMSLPKACGSFRSWERVPCGKLGHSLNLSPPWPLFSFFSGTTIATLSFLSLWFFQSSWTTGLTCHFPYFLYCLVAIWCLSEGSRKCWAASRWGQLQYATVSYDARW